MNEPTEFKYPLDEYGEPYFAGSHVDAIQGMEDIKDRLEKAEADIADNSSGSNTDIQNINSRLDKAESDISTNLSDSNTKFQTVNNRLDTAEANIQTNSEKQVNLENALEGYMRTTGWVSYADSVASGVEVDVMYGSYNGMKCALKEVRIGLDGVTHVVRYKTISYNLRSFKLGEQVAQLPTGFVKNAQLFPAFGNGNMSSYRIEIMPDGKMTILGGTNDKTLSPSSYWVYGQHTWIE
ncbi:hypothetical protein [Mammaliicoccus sciuri]|uniref:hypothetical protein n=1 Tax=Mammaliicoccus sciuri TaxID=1296 RepID=UPI001FB37468|nr:hypothetical protein [Mammaliicoccus sciuri]MCJ1765558.1 hypothetical protein [Mammaliicoccus sciuri]MCJ1773206.1 hypothetical protein [Mammaliicoccus sciuri]